MAVMLAARYCMQHETSNRREMSRHRGELYTLHDHHRGITSLRKAAPSTIPASPQPSLGLRLTRGPYPPFVRPFRTSYYGDNAVAAWWRIAKSSSSANGEKHIWCI